MQTPIRNYTKKRLAQLYEVTTRTLLTWIIEYNILTADEIILYKKIKIIPSPIIAKIFASKLGRPEAE